MPEACSESDVVVGGGVAGIAAALLSVRRGRSVTLIEPQAQVGGLLRSHNRPGFGWFDYGTHILAETGNSELDALLYTECYGEDWYQYPSIKSNTFFGGQLSSIEFPDARSLPSDYYQQGLTELLSLPRAHADFANLEEYTTQTYGSVFSAHIYGPVLHKLTGLPLSELCADAHLLFGLKRLVCGTPSEARRWKQEDSWYDERLAFHDVIAGIDTPKSFYPKRQGIGLWAESVQQRLREFGVDVRTQCSISQTHMDGKRAVGVTLSTGETKQCNRLVWSAPTIFLLKSAGIDTTFVSRSLQCKTILVDMVLDRPLLFDGFYLTCFDQDISMFRITNYAALQQIEEGQRCRVTVEIIIPPGHSSGPVSSERLLSEMKGMGILDQNTQLVASWLNKLPQGFPTPTPAFRENSSILAERAAELIENAVLLGRSSGRAFFMKDVLLDTFEQLNV